MRKTSVLTVLLLCVLSAAAFAATVSPLFIVERNKNANIVVYETQLDAVGALVADAPVAAHWKLKATTGKDEKLSMFDKKAYGFSVKKDGDNYRMTLAPIKKRPMMLMKDGATFRAQMPINGTPSWLSKVYVQAKEGAILPKVEYLELFGTAVAGGQKTYEKFVP